MNVWWFRYAQYRAGRRLHMTEAFMGGLVSMRALCGFAPGEWRMTIDVPLAHACRNCSRVYAARGIQGAVAQ